jgi:hypothetical protein
LHASPIELLDAKGVTFSDDLLEKEPGATKFDSTGITGKNIMDIHAWQDPNGQRLVCTTKEGDIYVSDTTPFSNLDANTGKTGLSTSPAKGKFLECGNESSAANSKHLFYFNGYDVIQVLDANATAFGNIGTPPADWTGTNQPVGGTVHDNRVVGYGNANDPHRLYYSDPDNHEDFTTTAAFTQPINSHVGKRIWNAVSFNGLLFVWKYPVGIFYVDDSDIKRANWYVRTKSEAIGCAPSPKAVLALDDDVLFMAADGSIHLLSAVNSQSGVRGSDLTYALGLTKWIQDNVALDKLNQVDSVWYPSKKQAIFTLPGSGDSTNTVTLKFDFGVVDAGSPIRFSYSERDAADAVALYLDSNNIPRPIMGEGVFAWKLDQASRTKGGAYTASWQTPYLSMGHIDRTFSAIQKNWDNLEVIFDPTGTGDLSVDVYVDGTKRTDTALTFTSTNRRQRRTLRVGTGYEISIAGSNAVDTENPKVLGMILGFRGASEDQSK